MKTEWLIHAGNPALIVFCSGWAMDGEPFRFLSSKSHDVLVCFDYREGKHDHVVAKAVEKYQRAILLSWSMGVYYAQRNLLDLDATFSKKIAVNGTLCPIDDQFGIPKELFKATFEGLTEENLQRFFRRMHKPGGNWKMFLDSRPKRTVMDQRQELEMMLKESGCFTETDSFYTKAVVSGSDYIFPTVNQQRFWQKTPVTRVDGCHFPFYTFSSWEDLLAELV